MSSSDGRVERDDIRTLARMIDEHGRLPKTRVVSELPWSRAKATHVAEQCEERGILRVTITPAGGTIYVPTEPHTDHQSSADPIRGDD